MFAFHALGRYHPEFLSADENKERLKDFRLRLGYFARGTQNYITNIDVLIKDLFHNPPSYKSTVTLSWKQLEVIRFVRLILAGNARFFKI